MLKYNNYTKIICALLSHSSIREAAKVLNMPETKLWYILEKDDFIEMFQKVQANLLQHVTGRLVSNLSIATTNILDIIENTNYPVKVRLDACKVILEYAAKYTEVSHILPRIKRLEEEMENK